MFKLLGNQLWYFRIPNRPGVLIANGVPSEIKDPDLAAQWAEDMGSNSYESLMSMAEEYREKAENCSDPETRMSYLDLEREVRERAEMYP